MQVDIILKYKLVFPSLWDVLTTCLPLNYVSVCSAGLGVTSCGEIIVS